MLSSGDATCTSRPFACFRGTKASDPPSPSPAGLRLRAVQGRYITAEEEVVEKEEEEKGPGAFVPRDQAKGYAVHMASPDQSMPERPQWPKKQSSAYARSERRWPQRSNMAFRCTTSQLSTPCPGGRSRVSRCSPFILLPLSLNPTP